MVSRCTHGFRGFVLLLSGAVGSACSLLNVPTSVLDGPDDGASAAGGAGGSKAVGLGGSGASGGGSEGGDNGSGANSSSGGSGGAGGTGASASCGDGVIDFDLNEECDDGNSDGDDACSPDCKRTVFVVAESDGAAPVVAPNGINDGEGFSLVWVAGDRLRVRAYDKRGLASLISGNPYADVSAPGTPADPALVMVRQNQQATGFVVWTDYPSTTSSSRAVFARRLDSSGLPLDNVQWDSSSAPYGAPAVVARGEKVAAGWFEENAEEATYDLWVKQTSTSSFSTTSEVYIDSVEASQDKLSMTAISNQVLATYLKDGALTSALIDDMALNIEFAEVAKPGAKAWDPHGIGLSQSTECAFAFIETSNQNGTDIERVMHRRFSEPKQAVGSEEVAGDATLPSGVKEASPRITGWVDPDTSDVYYLVFWIQTSAGGDSIFARAFQADGTPVTADPITVHSSTSEHFFNLSVAVNRKGGVFFTWENVPASGPLSVLALYAPEVFRALDP